MKRLLALTLKEFRQLVRDQLTLRMIVMVPLMQMIIFGYAINFDVKHLPMVVFDESRSYESRELVAKMQASQYFDWSASVSSFEEVRRALDTAEASVALVIDARVRPRSAPGRAGACDADRQRLGFHDLVASDVDRLGHRQQRLDADAGR